MKFNTDNTLGDIFKPEYKITDHLGSTRVVLNEAGNVKAEYDYVSTSLNSHGFYTLVSTSSTSSKSNMTPVVAGLDRETWIGKEKDVESGLEDFSVRK